MTLNPIIPKECQLGIDDGSGKTARERIYASFLDQIDWTKTILVYNSQGKIESIVSIKFGAS